LHSGRTVANNKIQAVVETSQSGLPARVSIAKAVIHYLFPITPITDVTTPELSACAGPVMSASVQVITKNRHRSYTNVIRIAKTICVYLYPRTNVSC
jgi:hypothetical protein